MIAYLYDELVKTLKFTHADAVLRSWFCIECDAFFRDRNIKPETWDYDKWNKDSYIIFPSKGNKYMIQFGTRYHNDQTMIFSMRILMKKDGANNLFIAIFHSHDSLYPEKCIMKRSNTVWSDNNNPVIDELIKMISDFVEKSDQLWNSYDTILHPDYDPEGSMKETPIDHALDVLRMELSKVNYSKRVKDTITISDFMKLDIDDVNEKPILYWCPDFSLMNKIEEKFKEWMLGKMYRVRNVRLNGLFYVENCDLMDISEIGYDTLDNTNGDLIQIVKEGGVKNDK